MRNIANTTELTSAVLARYIASTVGPAKQLIDKVCENTRKGIFRLISMVEAESKFAPLAAEDAYKNVVSHLADANRALALALESLDEARAIPKAVSKGHSEGGDEYFTFPVAGEAYLKRRKHDDAFLTHVCKRRGSAWIALCGKVKSSNILDDYTWDGGWDGSTKQKATCPKCAKLDPRP